MLPGDNNDVADPADGVETADPDVYDSASNFIVTYQRDGKIVYLLRVEKDDLKVNALKADAVAEHKYVGCGDNNAKAPKDCYKDVKNSNYWIKSDADDAVAYVTVDGDYDNVVAVRAATVFGKDGNWDRNSTARCTLPRRSRPGLS